MMVETKKMLDLFDSIEITYSRALTGHLQFPKEPQDDLKKVLDTYDALYKIWNISIPKLIPQPKCFAQSPEIKVSDTLIDPDDTVTDQHDVHVRDSTPGLNDEFEKLL